MKKYLLALFFAICVQNVSAEVGPIQGGSSGGVSVTGNNAFTGANTSAGSFSFQNGSTVTFQSGAIINGTWGVVDSSSPVGGVTSWTSTFDTALTTSAVVELHFNITGITANDGDLYIQFNGDSGTNYFWGVHLMADNGAGAGTSDGGAAAVDRCKLHRATFLDTGDNISGKVTCRIKASGSMRVLCYIQSALDGAALGRGESGTGMCRYSGSANITSMTIGRTAGAMYGDLRRVLLR